MGGSEVVFGLQCVSYYMCGGGCSSSSGSGSGSSICILSACLRFGHFLTECVDLDGVHDVIMSEDIHKNEFGEPEFVGTSTECS